MDVFKDPIRLVIVCGLLIAALLVGYNAFYNPSAKETVFVDKSSYSSDKESYGQDSVSENLLEAEKDESLFPDTPKVNINTADKEALAELDGIGDTIAQRIIDYRNENGGFKSTDDLMNVNGIGKQKYELIKDSITI